MSSPEAHAGFTHMDGDGYITLPKSVMAQLGVGAGSELAWVRRGDAVLLIPLDEDLERVFAAARAALARAGI